MEHTPHGIQETVRAASAAIYRVSEVANFDPVLRFELRKRSVEVLTRVSSQGSIGRERDGAFYTEITEMIRAIQELVQLGSSTRFIAPENGERISQAYDRIARALESEVGNGIKKLPSSTLKHEEASIEREPRKDRIIKYLGEQGQAPIGRIREFLGNTVSEKTLQRDLVELVSSGLLKRQGDNRWTVYSSTIPYRTQRS